MENLLLRYMENRLREEQNLPMGTAPFLTISREFGCCSKIIATGLVDQLNHRPGAEHQPKWKYINKEIVEASARELDLDPMKLKYLFNAEHKGILGDVLASFSDSYKSDLKIRKTIIEVTRAITSKGYVILVGRGGVALTQGFSNALHIRLQAPLEWRIRDVARRSNIPEEEARTLAVETDKKRNGLIELFLGRKFDTSIFDLAMNCKTLSMEEITRTILSVMELRRMI